MAKAKGTIVLPSVRFLRTRKEEARKVLPERFHHYLEERIQTAQWYPEEDFVALLRATAELLPGSGPALFEQLGRATAAEHLAGVYQHLVIQGGDALALARRSFALWSSMHDTGRMRAIEAGPTGATFLLESYASPSAEMCATVTGYFDEALRLAGLAATIRKRACVLDGDPHCAWAATWTEPSDV